VFGTLAHDTHRLRRGAINPFFSKSAVRKLQPIIDERVDALLTRFRGFVLTGKPMTLNYAFAAFTNDIAQEYAFARSDHRIEQPDFEPTFHDASIAGSTGGTVMKQFPRLLPFLQSLPDSFSTWLDPNMGSYFNLQRRLREQIKEMKSGKVDDSKDANHRTIFYEIMNSDLADREKSDERLWQDGQTMVIAGTLTTAWSLCIAAYYLLSQPETLRALKTELATVLQGPASRVPIDRLQQLPYLTGCVQECIRLGYGVSTRLERIAPNETLVFNDGKKDWTIPPGTPVAMTSSLVHHVESVFPDSRKFLPERWINHPHLDKYLVSFAKGSRQCVGINLAYAELYIVLARLFRAYGSKEVRDEMDVGYLELFETTIDNVEMGQDYFLPLARNNSTGVRIIVRK